MESHSKLPSQRHAMSKPQIFVHLEFGVSWSQRHTPRTHTVTYTSRNLRNSRDRGAFPRQLPPPSTNFLANAENRPHRPREPREQPGHHNQQHNPPSQQPQQHQSSHHHHQHHQQHQSEQVRGQDRPRDHERSRQPQRDESREQRHQRRESRSESRGLSHERGKSAPPPFHDSPWDAEPGPSASLFPSAAAFAAAAAAAKEEEASLEEPRVWKPLPEPPSRFRLGEDGLPWSAWAWPIEPSEPAYTAEDEEAPPFANQPTTLPIHTEQPRTDDGERVRELESLSAAMMTVDNGFENQWWHQGPRQVTGWWPRDQEEPSRLSMDATLFSAAEPPVTSTVIPPPHGWYAPTTSLDERSSMLEGIVSPISTVSTTPARVLQRSMTTRSEELFIGNAL